jgi:hypothetical protein
MIYDIKRYGYTQRLGTQNLVCENRVHRVKVWVDLKYEMPTNTNQE